MIAACYCTFKRTEDADFEPGLALTTEHGMSSVIAIYPADATHPDDAVEEVYDYRLDWTQGLYPRHD